MPKAVHAHAWCSEHVMTPGRGCARPRVGALAAPVPVSAGLAPVDWNGITSAGFAVAFVVHAVRLFRAPEQEQGQW